MDNDELKAWMDERFTRNDKDHESLKNFLIDVNKKVTTHDRWLWMIRGIGAAAVAFLGWIGFKVG